MLAVKDKMKHPVLVWVFRQESLNKSQKSLNEISGLEASLCAHLLHTSTALNTLQHFIHVRLKGIIVWVTVWVPCEPYHPAAVAAGSNYDCLLQVRHLPWWACAGSATRRFDSRWRAAPSSRVSSPCRPTPLVRRPTSCGPALALSRGKQERWRSSRSCCLPKVSQRTC